MHNQHRMLRVFRLIAMLRQRPARTIKNISGSLGISERSAYRYIDLVGELGFHVQTDSYRRLYIDGDDSIGGAVTFTPEEASLMRDLLLSAGRDNKLCDGILKKLFANAELQVQSEMQHRAHLSRMVEEIGRAIAGKKQVVLKKYLSANSNNVRDRLVEPVKFTNGYQRLVAYEPECGQNKAFNLERITAVRITRKNWTHEEQHQFTPPDVFGFHENGKSYPVDMELPLRAAVVLREEYPMTASCLTPVKGTSKFRFRTTVHDMRPLKRFLKGWEE